MNAGEERFAHGLAAKMTQRAAYYAAGYTAKTDAAADTAAWRLAKNVEVQARVKALLDLAAERVVEQSVLDETLIRDAVVTVIKEGLKKVPIISGGEVIGEKCTDLPSVNSAAKLGAALLDMIVSRQSIELSGETKKLLDSIVASIAAEVEDPAVLERIISRLTLEGAGAPTG